MTNIHQESLKCFLICRAEPSYLNTLLPCKRTFFEKARKTIMKQIIKSLSFNGECKECDSVFLSKDDHEFFFLFVLSGWERLTPNCLHFLCLC